MKRIIPYFLILSAVSWSASAQESDAMRALRISCEKHKVALGCYNYANMLIRRNIEHSEKYFTLGCGLNHSPSCNKEQWAPMNITPDPEIPMPAQIAAPETPVEDVPAEPIEVAAPETPVEDVPAEPIELAAPETPVEEIPAEPIEVAAPETPVEEIPSEPIEVAAPETPVQDLVAPDINIESMQEESSEVEVALPAEVPVENAKPTPSPAPASVNEPEVSI